MKKKGPAAREFDRPFDAGGDVHDLIDMEKAKVIRHGKKVRLTIDIAESPVNELDERPVPAGRFETRPLF
jgi:hypothetical protein